MEGITGGEEVLMKPDKHVMQNLAMITPGGYQYAGAYRFVCMGGGLAG